MLMHFHAHVLYILYILIYWLWLVLFCVSLSFPLSLVYVSCVMAPKHKSTPSQNPLHSRASTSSDPTPSHIQFRDGKARHDFSKNFSRRGVHLERQVILSDFFDTNLPTVIHSRGWKSLCDILITCPSVLVQEFYSNMHGFDYSVPLFVTCVRGTRIMVTPNIVSNMLHVHKVAHPNYPSFERLRTVSKDELISSFCERPSD